MINRNQQRAAPRVTETRTSQGVLTTLNEVAIGQSETFSVITNNPRGDRVTPNNHEFRKTSETPAWTGFRLVEFPQGGSVLIRGPLSNTDAFGANYSSLPYNSALAKIWSSYRGDLDLSIDILDAPKTAKMVADMWKSVRMYRDTFDRMKRATPRDAGNLHLQYIYGIKPTYMSIYDTLREIMQPSYQWQRIEASSAVTDETSTFRDKVGEPGIKESIKRTVKTRCKISLVLTGKSTWLQKLGAYTSLNPVSIAYERFPFSFVMDWIVDVGGYLRNYESAMIYGSNFHSGYVTETCLTTEYGQRSGSFKTSSQTVTDVAEYTFRQASKRRRRLTSIPFPRAPRLNPSLGVSRLLSAASLLSQQVKSWEVRLPREHRFR